MLSEFANGLQINHPISIMPSPKNTKKLTDIPNVGKAVAEDLRIIGITKPEDLKGKNGIQLYEKLNRITGVRHDPCMADTLMAIVAFMKDGKVKPWWEYTAKRKKIFNKAR